MRRILSVFLRTALLCAFVKFASAGGGRSYGEVFFHEDLDTPEQGLGIQIFINHLEFDLVTLSNRYRFARLRLHNGTAQPIVLSSGDTMTVVYEKSRSRDDGQTFGAILDLQSGDPNTWAMLSESIQSQLHYSRSVAPDETISMVFFIPLRPEKDGEDLERFRYFIKASGQTLDVRRRRSGA